MKIRKGYLKYICQNNGDRVKILRIGWDWLHYRQNGFGFKRFELTIPLGRKSKTVGYDRFFYIEITNRPQFWVQLYWGFHHNYGHHFI